MKKIKTINLAPKWSDLASLYLRAFAFNTKLGEQRAKYGLRFELDRLGEPVRKALDALEKTPKKQRNGKAFTEAQCAIIAMCAEFDAKNRAAKKAYKKIDETEVPTNESGDFQEDEFDR